METATICPLGRRKRSGHWGLSESGPGLNPASHALSGRLLANPVASRELSIAAPFPTEREPNVLICLISRGRRSTIRPDFRIERFDSTDSNRPTIASVPGKDSVEAVHCITTLSLRIIHRHRSESRAPDRLRSDERRWLAAEGGRPSGRDGSLGQPE